jgi:hypothetical protein
MLSDIEQKPKRVVSDKPPYRQLVHEYSDFGRRSIRDRSGRKGEGSGAMEATFTNQAAGLAYQRNASLDQPIAVSSEDLVSMSTNQLNHRM